jgi:acyl-coenzyme A synthetase/AMP-(fatty) acid ligase
MVEKLVWHSSHFPAPDENRVSESLPVALARGLTLWSDRPAILHGNQCYSFLDLARRAAGLAEEIQQTDSGTGPLALLQSVGIDAVAAWFACALAGRAFVLLEPDHPPTRLQELIEAAGCTLILCDATTSHNVPNQLSALALISDGRNGSMSLDNALAADRPAMIFPTSGSTGTPKMVAYTASTLQVKIQASRQLMRVPMGARVHIAGSHANYGFLHHALVFLFSGGALCLADVKAGGFGAVSEAILRLGARHVRFTPSMFRTYALSPEARSALPCLEAIRFSGEPLLRSDLELAQSILQSGCLIQNVYGSTESALFIWSSGDEIDHGATVPIGHIYPLSSYALQRQDDDEPDDHASGQLLIRSAFHAQGDFRNGAIDQARFRSCPDDTKEKIYETGDRVKRLSTGGLLHLGRMGRMVKIRGQRVFLTEIENHLRAMLGVTGAAVVERTEGASTALYGFITMDAPDRWAEEPRAWLASRLPDFMMPRHILILPQIPLMPGGKVDHAALLAAVPHCPCDQGTPEPSDDAYDRLAQTWDSVLWPGAHRQTGDFASLGGDSLKIMQLALEIERHFGRTVAVKDFVKDATLQNLATLLGIEIPALALIKPEGLVLRKVWPAREPSQGIALATPGWSGYAQAVLFRRAEMFIDHDLWGADFGIKDGPIVKEGHWWRAAIEIADQIRSGAIPSPHVIFGYSVGGSIAWLVSRLLAGTPHCPPFVVMVDASPLHRLPAYHHIELERVLAAVSDHAPPPVLHIRRAPLPAFGIGIGNTSKWELEDNIIASVDLPTTDHLEMSRSDVLSLAAQTVAAFIHGQPPSVISSIPAADLDIYGVRLHKILSNPHPSEQAEFEAIVREMPAHLELHCLLGLLQRAVQDGRDTEAQDIVQAGLLRYPRSRLMHYAKYRFDRNPKMLCPNDTPKQFSTRLREIEKALAQRPRAAHGAPQRHMRQMVQIVDAARAVLAATAGRILKNRAPKPPHPPASSL